MMVYDLMDTVCAENGEPSNVAAGIPAERFSAAFLLPNPLSYEMGLPELAAQCHLEHREGLRFWSARCFVAAQHDTLGKRLGENTVKMRVHFVHSKEQGRAPIPGG